MVLINLYLSFLWRYTTHNHTSPELSLIAVKIIYLICQSPAAQPEIFNILTGNEVIFFKNHREVVIINKLFGLYYNFKVYEIMAKNQQWKQEYNQVYVWQFW